MKDLDVDLELVRRLLSCAFEQMQYLDTELIPGWGIYILQGVERLLPAGDRDAMLALIRDAISDRLTRGTWE